MYENVEPFNCDPPGTYREPVPHPGGEDRDIEKAVIMEHRFAFFFWMKWRNLLREQGLLRQAAPTLITFDWHRDLAPPADDLKVDLLQLEQADYSEVSNFVWARFDQTNDGHILCATWLNLVGDVILLKNTSSQIRDRVLDHEGNEHGIYEFREFERFQDFVIDREDKNIFFDIDLDYFIHGKGQRHYSEDFHRYTDKEIKSIIDPRQPVFQHILPNIDGMTLAQEPGYCGGIRNSCHIMEILHAQLFDDRKQWKHLSQYSN